MIEVDDLHKRFGDVQAVAGISFAIRSGEIYGLLGPNGAGKSTTINMLADLLQPDSGRILYDGVDLAANPEAVKKRLGIVPQDIALYEELTAKENLRFWGSLYGLAGSELQQAIDRVLDRVGLTQKADVAVKKYSGGMKRRLNLSLGVVHEPTIVLMDEPTVGIDPQARANILDVVRGLTEGGTTVLYTTHYLEEAETLCDRIGIMDHGKLLAEGTLDELKRMLGEGEVVTVQGSFEEEHGRQLADSLNSAQILKAEPGRLVLGTSADKRQAVDLLARLLGSDLAVDDVSIQPPSLNGLFLKLTGRELRD